MFAAVPEISLLEQIIRGGIAAFLLIVLYGGFKKEPWWVFGWLYRDVITENQLLKEQLIKERENATEWMQQALRGTTIAQEAMSRGKRTGTR